jgi:hypothetical protein
MRQPPGRTPPPPTLAPPPRRRTPGGKPVNPASPPIPASPGPTAPARAAGRSRGRPPAPRPDTRRRPNHARRRTIALALLLTIVILLGYGAYVAYDQLTGNDTPAAQATDDYVASAETAISHGLWSVAMGINFHNLKDSYILRNQFNTEIDTVRSQRANLEALLPNVLGPRADTVRASIQSMSQLEAAIGQWRDAIFLLRLGSVDDAQASIESAVAALQQQVDTWNRQPAS